MEYMPQFIQDTYKKGEENDYALKAKIAMDGLANHPEDAQYIFAYAGTFLRAAKQYEESIEHCFKYLPLMDIWECRVETLNCIVYAYEALNRFPEAIEIKKQLLKEAENTDPGFCPMIITDIAEAYEKLGDANNAIAYYEMLGENSRDQIIYERLAALYEKIKDWNNAAVYNFKAAQYHSRESAWFWSNAGRMLALAGKEEEAKFYLQVALTIDPQDANAHYNTGVIYQNKNDMYRALHHYTEALKIQPEFPEVYHNIAALSFNEEGDIKKAIQNIETALKQNPNRQLLITLYLNLAQLYKKIADYDNHEYYTAKMMETIGFPVEYVDDEDDEGGNDDDEEEK